MNNIKKRINKDNIMIITIDCPKSKVNKVSSALLDEVLSLQQNLVLKKAQTMLHSGTQQQKCDAAQAITLIETSRNTKSVAAAGNVLHPSEYTVRANALVVSRRLVGGVEIEVVEDMQAARAKR